MQVVDDLLAHVDRRPVELERLLDRLDGALDAGAVAARRREEDLLDHRGHRSRGARSLPNDPEKQKARCSGGRRSGPRVDRSPRLMASDGAPRIASPSAQDASAWRGVEGIGRAAHLCKPHRYDRCRTVSARRTICGPSERVDESGPLQRRAAAGPGGGVRRRGRGAAARALARPGRAPTRSTGRSRLVFPGVAVAAGDLRRARPARPQAARRPPLGLLRRVARRARAGAAAPRALARPRVRGRRDRPRSREAEERSRHRDRELEAVAEISSALGRARDALEDRAAARAPRHDAPRRRVRRRRPRRTRAASGRPASTARSRVSDGGPGGRSCELDLRDEPSGIASAVFDAAPVTRLRRRELAARQPARLAERVGAESGVWIPMIAEERVIGVLAVASTDAKRAFSADELALLQAVAARRRSRSSGCARASALSDALGREQAVGEIARRVRAELDAGGDRAGRARGAAPRRCAPTTSASRSPRTRHTVARAAHRRARAERAAPRRHGRARGRRRRSTRRGCSPRTGVGSSSRRALLHAAQVVTSELDLETVLQRLVEEVTKLLGADAADCYLLDRERGVLRCAAVHGFDAEPRRLRVRADAGRRRRSRCGRRARSRRTSTPTLAAPVPNPAYAGFRRALVAPMVWAGETRGVLGVGLRERRAVVRPGGHRDARGVRLARLARASQRRELRRAARGRRACSAASTGSRSLLGEPLSLDETYDAAAQAAAEALGGDFAAVLVPGPAGLVRRRRSRAPGRGARAPAAAARSRRRPTTGRCSPRRTSRRTSASTTPGAAARSRRCSRSRCRAKGAVSCSSSSGSRATFARDDLELAQQVAGAARGALDRSRLFEAERTARALSQQLARTGSLLATELDPVAVLEAVVEEAAGLLARRRRRARRARGRRARRHGGHRRRCGGRRSARGRRRPAGSAATSSSRARRSPARTSGTTSRSPSRTRCSPRATGRTSASR